MTRKEELEILIGAVQNMVSSHASLISGVGFNNKYFKEAFEDLKIRINLLESYINEIEKL